MIEGYILGSRFTMGAVSGVADSIFFHHEHTGIPDNNARGAIYTVSGDKPDVLIKETGLHAITTADGWVQLDFLEQPTLMAGTEYFILIWIEASLTGTSTVSYDIPGGNQGFTKGVGYGPVGNFPVTMTGGTVRTFRFSLYATYDQILGTITNDLKAVFHVGQDSKDLKAVFRLTQEDVFAKFILRQGTLDLFSTAVIRNAGSADLKGLIKVVQTGTPAELAAQFLVRKANTKDLFAELVVFRPYADLKTTFSVRAVATKEIPAEAVIRHSATKDLHAEFTIRRSTTKDLKAVTTIRHTNTNELYAVFWVGGSADLKATLYIPVKRNQPAYYPIIDDGIAWWINFLDLQGKGFIGYPTIENDNVKVFSGVDSLKITSERVDKGFKEITLGWLYTPVSLNPIRDTPCVPIRKEFDLLIREDWDWGGVYLYDDSYLVEDTTIKVTVDTDFGFGGWQYANVNYSSETYLRCSVYEGFYPGEIPSQWHYNDETIMMKWTLPTLAALPSLSRLAWARIELYRYNGSTGAEINTRRIPECEDVTQRYTGGNPANIIGGCSPYTDYGGVPYSSSGKYLIDTWTPETALWYNFGRWQFGFGLGQYMGNSSFRADPTGRGISWDNNEYEGFDFTELFKAWLNGTYENLGMLMEMIATPGKDWRMNLVGGSGLGPSFYSKNAGSNRPRYRLQFWPEGKSDVWEFENNRAWEINEDTPYAGSGSLKLKDWSKLETLYQSGAASYLKYKTTHALTEGYIDTKIKFNRDEIAQIRVVNQSDPDEMVEEVGTPATNEFELQFRYQNSSNHYNVQFRPGQLNSRIRRKISGASTTLNSFEGRFKVGTWYNVRVFWTLNEDGEFKICCYKYDDEQLVWRFLGGALDADNYWPDGGEVRFESWDADIDDTEIWEGR